MLLYKTKSFCNIGLNYKLLRSRIVDLTFRFFFKKCKFYDLRTRTGGGGFTRPIPKDGSADQLHEVPIIGRLPTDGTRGPEVRRYGRIWPDEDGPVQGNQARDVKDSVIQNHSCCMKESRLDQPCGDKS